MRGSGFCTWGEEREERHATAALSRYPDSRPPRSLLLPPAQELARRLTATPLSGTNSIVGTEPAMADATRALPGNWHDEPSSPSPAQILSCNLDYRTGESLLESTPRLILESAEDAVDE